MAYSHERIRSNSRRYWDYLTQLLIELAESSISTDAGPVKQFHEAPAARRHLLHLMRQILSSPNTFDDEERRTLLISQTEKPAAAYR